MAAIQQARRERTRERLLAAAGRVFAQRGYHGATLEDVANAAGVSKGALYYNYRSKDDLFLSLLEARLLAGFADVEALIGEAENGTQALDAFLGRIERDPRWLPLLLEFLAYGARNRQVAQGLAEHFFTPTRERLGAVIGALLGSSEEELPLPAEQLASGVAALVNGLAIERRFAPGAVPDRLLPQLLELLALGLRQRSDQRRRQKGAR
jgi:AcrR family transcriptional regulator